MLRFENKNLQSCTISTQFCETRDAFSPAPSNHHSRTCLFTELISPRCVAGTWFGEPTAGWTRARMCASSPRRRSPGRRRRRRVSSRTAPSPCAAWRRARRPKSCTDSGRRLRHLRDTKLTRVSVLCRKCTERRALHLFRSTKNCNFDSLVFLQLMQMTLVCQGVVRGVRRQVLAERGSEAAARLPGLPAGQGQRHLGRRDAAQRGHAHKTHHRSVPAALTSQGPLSCRVRIAQRKPSA